MFPSDFVHQQSQLKAINEYANQDNITRLLNFKKMQLDVYNTENDICQLKTKRNQQLTTMCCPGTSLYDLNVMPAVMPYVAVHSGH